MKLYSVFYILNQSTLPSNFIPKFCILFKLICKNKFMKTCKIFRKTFIWALRHIYVQRVYMHIAKTYLGQWTIYEIILNWISYLNSYTGCVMAPYHWKFQFCVTASVLSLPRVKFVRLVPLRTQMDVISLNCQALVLMSIWLKADI
jgi:hypothetical protein